MVWEVQNELRGEAVPQPQVEPLDGMGADRQLEVELPDVLEAGRQVEFVVVVDLRLEVVEESSEALSLQV